MNQALINLLATADYADLSDAEAAALASTPTVTTRPYYVSYRTLASIDLAAADAVMTALRASHADLAALMMQAGATDGSAGGVDVSLETTIAMIDQFAAGGIITTEQAAAIKSLAESKTYPAGGVVTESDVTEARATMAALAKVKARRQSLANDYNAAMAEVAQYEVAIAAGTAPATAPWEEAG